MSNVNLISLLATALAGWVNQHQQAIIDYLIEENRIFKLQLNGRKLELSDNDRRRLAAKAKALGREILDEIANTACIISVNVTTRVWIISYWSRLTLSLTLQNRFSAVNGRVAC